MAQSESFDPYHKWLGIPPREQPPNHYRLLGLGLFEDDRDVIDMVAGRQIEHVRSLALGAYADEAQKLLNELAAARVCLLNADKKAAYDARLRAALERAVVPMAAAAPPLVALPVPEIRPAEPPHHAGSLDRLHTPQYTQTRWRAKRSGPAWPVLALLALVALACGWWAYNLQSPTTKSRLIAESATKAKSQPSEVTPPADPFKPVAAADVTTQKQPAKTQPHKPPVAKTSQPAADVEPPLTPEALSAAVAASAPRPLEMSIDAPAIGTALPAVSEPENVAGAAAAHLTIDDFSWSGGKRVRMDKSAFAFCGFSQISGALEGYSERAMLALGPDGFFYLGGISSQRTFTVRAMTVHLAQRSRFKLPEREYVWQPNRPPLKLLEDGDGFCVLSAISGQFGGAADLVHVYLDEEGDWCLGGTSTNPVSAAALVFAWRQHAVPLAVEHYRWQAGMSPVRMISRTAGFCLLSGIGGAFEGAGEMVEVRIADDGYWYLSGRSGQPSLVAEAISVSFP